MPKAVERRLIRRITREYERKGYSAKRAGYIARATVYHDIFPGPHHHKGRRRR